MWAVGGGMIVFAMLCLGLFTKEPCVFKAKPASKTVRALPMKKLKEMIN